MEKELINLISEIIEKKPSDLSMNSGPQIFPEWDSLAHITIIGAVESKYNISFNMNDILSIKSIGDLKTKIDKYID